MTAPTQVSTDEASGLRASGNASEDIRVVAQIPLAGPNGPFSLDVNLSLAKGSFTVLSGPSGAGKTSLLRFIAGLARSRTGAVCVGPDIWFDAARQVNRPTQRRSIGYVFQDYALFPNMTVAGNVAYALGRTPSKSDIERLLVLVDLGALAGAYPDRLSGGQKQRLALIRALARRPAILLLDEPLSALDPQLRRQMQDLLRRLHAEFATTTIMVSHDPAEMLRLADEVIRLEEGRVVFRGTPQASICPSEDDGSLRLLVDYVSGPDTDGRVTVRFDGRLSKLPLRHLPRHCAPGDTIMVNVEEVAVTHLPEHRTS